MGQEQSTPGYFYGSSLENVLDSIGAYLKLEHGGDLLTEEKEEGTQYFCSMDVKICFTRKIGRRYIYWNRHNIDDKIIYRAWIDDTVYLSDE